MHKLVTLGLLIVALGALPAAGATPPATDLAAETGCQEADPGQGYARLTWTPAPSGVTEQRVDVTIERDGFATGNFTSSAALPPEQQELVWTELQGQAVHFWRVRSAGPDGETASAEASFEGPTCAVDQQPSRVEVLRVAGEDVAGTAVAVSRHVFPAADEVVLARHDVYADALAGAALAGALHAPVLLTGSQRLDPVARDEIQRLGATRAVLLGGVAALSAQVQREVEALGVVVVRLAGPTRFETAARVAERVVGDERGETAVYLVEGANADPARGWPDAVSVSGLAGLQARPVLLVTRDTLPDATRQALEHLGVSTVTIVGGTEAVAESVAAEVAELGIAVKRVAGATRYGTSRLIADATVAAAGGAEVAWLATGRSHQDALIAGPAAAATGGVLLLVDGQDLDGSPPSADWLLSVREQLRRVRLVGGPEAISEDTEAEVQAIFDEQ